MIKKKRNLFHRPKSGRFDYYLLFFYEFIQFDVSPLLLFGFRRTVRFSFVFFHNAIFDRKSFFFPFPPGFLSLDFVFFSLLDTRKEDTRKILERYSKDTRKIFERYSKDTRKILERYSKDTQKILERYSKDTRKILERYSKDNRKIPERT